MDVLQRDNDIWDLFTCREEYETTHRDRYDRFMYYQSRNREVSKPRASQMLIENGFRCEYPEEQPFAICLTHDIDQVYYSFLAKSLEIAQALKNGKPMRAARIVPLMCSKKYPWCNFREIIALEESYDAISSFYFQAEDGNREYAYLLEDMKQEMCMLHDRGWEVGLHGGCEAYRDPDRLKKEKRHIEKVLNGKVVGYRNHFLKFQVPTTWELLANEGFLYDTTLGYPDCVGFRNGMCHPFKPFNLNSGQEIDILEIPLVVMDQTLLSCMRLNIAKAWEHIEYLFGTVERQHGVITFLWHNTYMTGEPLDLYRKILKYGHDKGAWMTSCQNVAEWWKKSGIQSPPAISSTTIPSAASVPVPIVPTAGLMGTRLRD
jgi:peptidoglycan/xylan/chitin deacetylase (PgdA/CDA1 family)